VSEFALVVDATNANRKLFTRPTHQTVPQNRSGFVEHR